MSAPPPPPAPVPAPAASIAEIRASFAALRSSADGAVAQVPPLLLHRRLDPDSNSIAVLMQHLAGNMRSRWSDFLTTDGEKPDRRRDAEFEDPPDDARLREAWEEGWRTLFAALDALRPSDFARTVSIRGEPHTVHQAILRQLTHVAYHVGQIVLLAKHAAGPAWRTLTVPRGASDAHTAAVRAKHAGSRGGAMGRGTMGGGPRPGSRGGADPR